MRILPALCGAAALGVIIVPGRPIEDIQDERLPAHIDPEVIGNECMPDTIRTFGEARLSDMLTQETTTFRARMTDLGFGERF